MASDTDTIHVSGDLTYLFNESDNLFFYNPPGSDPNTGRIETYYSWGTWKSETSSNKLEYLTLNFPLQLSKYSLLNNRWKITDKWTNRIKMSDGENKLTIVVP